MTLPRDLDAPPPGAPHAGQPLAARAAAQPPGPAPRGRERLPRWLQLQLVTGAVPLAGYLVLHLATQLSALWGPGAHQRWGAVPVTAAWVGIELALVYLPLLVHVGLGFWRISHPPAVPAGWEGMSPLDRQLMRVSGGILLVFLLFHLAEYRLRLWSGELAPSDYYVELCASLSSTRWGGVPLTALGYLLGVGAAAHHGAQGLYQAALGLGVIDEGRALVLRRCCVLFGLCCFGLGALIVIDLATGSVLIHL